MAAALDPCSKGGMRRSAARGGTAAAGVAAALAFAGCASPPLPDPRHAAEAPRDELPAVGVDGWRGGEREVVVALPPAVVLRALTEPALWSATLPHLLAFEPLPGAPRAPSCARVTQGGALGTATYTACVARHEDSVRFWIDRTRPHGIDDARGWFRVSPHPAGARVRYRVRLRIGHLLTELLAGGTIEELALSMPERVRAHLEGPAVAAR
ncbi:MAG: SRPBCC family protein [Polyangiaceae bacterium]|nr:SRPBCC family protein [Polyangiaceae bacterium]